MSKLLQCCALTVLALTLMVTSAQAVTLDNVNLVTNLNRPIYVRAAPGDTERLFVVEQRGAIRILDLSTNSMLATAFLDIDALIDTISGNAETGLLGLAFDPNYFTNGFFFVYYTRGSDDHQIIVRYQVAGDPATSNVANAGSASLVLDFGVDPASNHNGGWMDFSPLDGYLYVSTGDGGGACDTGERAQNKNLLLGKMLRIDPNGVDNTYGTGDDDAFPADPLKNYAIPPSNPFAGGGGAGEVWAYGLRNPSRCNFDKVTGDLYIADVGQLAIEEIDFQPGSSVGGENYGWDCREGTSCANTASSAQCSGTTNGCVCATVASVDPIHQYTHSLGICISGGATYRGCRIPKLQRTYFFADFSTSRIWSFQYSGSGTVPAGNVVLHTSGGTNEFTGIGSIPGIGEDASGEIYLIQRGTGANGIISKIVALDAGPADINADLVVNLTDSALLVAVLLDVDTGDPAYVCRSDINGDGLVDGEDIQAWIDEI